jgi:hypothetical protein
MYAQLTAIAREFNFPSTAGLCLYLHYSVGGVVVTPRISDEVWLSIWSGALEQQAHPPAHSIMSQLNISARIEFDIDIHRARWYPIWLASSRKTASDATVTPEMSRPQSISHSRFNSRTTNIDEPAEFNLDDISAAQPYKVPTPTFRHVPKKLSLVDRFDASPLTALKQSEPHVLSPIVQEDEPKSAKHALERRVHSWIAGSSGKPSQLLPKLLQCLSLNRSPKLFPPFYHSHRAIPNLILTSLPGPFHHPGLPVPVLNPPHHPSIACPPYMSKIEWKVRSD